jgi:hypothetical protein
MSTAVTQIRFIYLFILNQSEIFVPNRGGSVGLCC